MNEKFLQRSDIVGKKITAIHTSEWIVEDDGYEFCHNAYVTLETGAVLGLHTCPGEEHNPIRNLAGESIPQVEFTPFSPELYRGKKILEFVIAETPCLGVLLENGYVVFWGMRGITIYGPTIELLKDVEYNHFVPYWSEQDFHRPIAYPSLCQEELKDILEFKDEYYFLDNFYPARVEWEGIEYPTIEHAFQATKTFDLELRRQIANDPNPFHAKKMGRSLSIRADWEERKYQIMQEIVLAKFNQCPELAQKLLATGDVRLEEGNHHGDITWGTVDGLGKNWLGIILMTVREKLKKKMENDT